MALSPERLASLLACKICLDTYHLPKNLDCGHVYCKDCLDKSLKFNEDGSAVIRCPLKCKNDIVIPKDGTTKSLSTSYGCAVIVDAINEQKHTSGGKRLDLCGQLQQCKRPISWLCSICSMKTCDECKKNHHCKDGIFTPVIYNTKTGDIQPMCSKHDSHTDYVCLQCDHALICVYCMHRDHKDHRTKTVRDFGLEIKTRFQPFITSFDEVKDVLPDLTIQYADAPSSLNMKRDGLVDEMRVRKLMRLKQYLLFLNKEEEHVLKEFNEKVEEFRLKVSTAGFDQMDYWCHKKFSDYVDNFKTKRNFELVIEKSEINKKFRNLTSLPSVAPCFDMQLDEMDYEELLKSALGQLQISNTDKNIVGTGIEQVSVAKFCITKTAHIPISEDLNHRLESFTDLLNAYSENSKIGGTVADVKLKKNNKLTHLESSTPLNETRTYSFRKLVQLINNNEVDALKAIVTDDPSIVKMRGTDNRETLLMKAVWNEKTDIAKVLIDARSDLWAKDNDGFNAYHCSAMCGQLEILQLLVHHDDVHINEVTADNCTPLHYASMYCNYKCAELLLSIPHLDVDVRGGQSNKTAYEHAREGKIKKLIAAHKRKSK